MHSTHRFPDFIGWSAPHKLCWAQCGGKNGLGAESSEDQGDIKPIIISYISKMCMTITLYKRQAAWRKCIIRNINQKEAIFSWKAQECLSETSRVVQLVDEKATTISKSLCYFLCHGYLSRCTRSGNRKARKRIRPQIRKCHFLGLSLRKTPTPWMGLPMYKKSTYSKSSYPVAGDGWSVSLWSPTSSGSTHPKRHQNRQETRKKNWHSTMH